MRQLFRIRFTKNGVEGEIHLGFYTEEEADMWCVNNSFLHLEYGALLPVYRNLGVLNAS